MEVYGRPWAYTLSRNYTRRMEQYNPFPVVLYEHLHVQEPLLVPSIARPAHHL